MIKRALTVNDVLSMKHDIFPFEGAWVDAFDTPEVCGVWFIWGNSGNGKSSFVMQLAKYLTQYGKVLYNALEEGKALTIKRAFKRAGMKEVNGKIHLVNDTIQELDIRLCRQRAPKIVIIDSVQYTGLNNKTYLEFTRKHAGKLIIFTSHAVGSRPRGKLAEDVMYDADLKIWIEGHKAMSKGRYIGSTGEYIIWEEGAQKYWHTL